MDALPHFAMRNDGGNGIVFGDFHPSREQMLTVSRDIFREISRAVTGADGNPDNKRAARKQARANKAAPCPSAFLLLFFDFGLFDVCVCSVGHDYAPFAAVLMAARMRSYIPQRQTLPDIAASISSSLGFGVSRSSATALII